MANNYAEQKAEWMEEGREAARRGFRASDNPYDPGNGNFDQHYYWREGHLLLSHSTKQEYEFLQKWGTAKERLEKARKSAAEYADQTGYAAAPLAGWRSQIDKPFNYAYYGKGGGVWGLPTLTRKVQSAEDLTRIYQLPRGDAERREWERREGTGLPFYVNDFDGFREVGDAHDVVRKHSSSSLDHTGWYCDSFQSELCIGVVLQLPYRALVAALEHEHQHTKRPMLDIERRLASFRETKPTSSYDDPQGYYIPATRRTECDGVTIYPLDWYDNPADAARAADGYAEKEAEDCREYDAKDQAEQDIGQAKTEIGETRQRMRALIAELREAREQGLNYPLICATLQERLEEMREYIHEQWELIRKRQDSYWSAVES